MLFRSPEDIDIDEPDGQGFDGVVSLRQALMPRSKDNSNVVKEQIPGIPVFPGPSTLREVVQKADVVLHVVDARDPAAGISDALAGAAQGKLIVLVNKAGVYDMWTGFSDSDGVYRHRATRIARAVARTSTNVIHGIAV